MTETTLQERLREIVPFRPYTRTGGGPVNRDGPEAAAEIDRLNALLAEMGEALEPFAALAKTFAGQTMIEVCVADPKNPSPTIVPIPASKLLDARTALTRYQEQTR